MAYKVTEIRMPKPIHDAIAELVESYSRLIRAHQLYSVALHRPDNEWWELIPTDMQPEEHAGWVATQIEGYRQVEQQMRDAFHNDAELLVAAWLMLEGVAPANDVSSI